MGMCVQTQAISFSYDSVFLWSSTPTTPLPLDSVNLPIKDFLGNTNIAASFVALKERLVHLSTRLRVLPAGWEPPLYNGWLWLVLMQFLATALSTPWLRSSLGELHFKPYRFFSKVFEQLLMVLWRILLHDCRQATFPPCSLVDFLGNLTSLNGKASFSNSQSQTISQSVHHNTIYHWSVVSR